MLLKSKLPRYTYLNKDSIALNFYPNTPPVENFHRPTMGRDLWNNEMSAGDRTMAAIGCVPFGGVAKVGKAANKLDDVVDGGKALKNPNEIKYVSTEVACFVAGTL